MTDPQPLTDDELALWRERRDDGMWVNPFVLRLIDAVDKARAERDALRTENARLQRELDDAQLRSIDRLIAFEAHNPGIDMAEVRQSRAAYGETCEVCLTPRWACKGPCCPRCTHHPDSTSEANQ